MSLGGRGDSAYEYLLKFYIKTRGARGEPRWRPAVDTLEAFRSFMFEVRLHLLEYSSGHDRLLFLGEVMGPLSNRTLPDHKRFEPKMDHLACFLPGVLAIAHMQGISTAVEAMEATRMLCGPAASTPYYCDLTPERKELLTLPDLEIAEQLARTCNQMYERTVTGLGPEITYFHTYLGSVQWQFSLGNCSAWDGVPGYWQGVLEPSLLFGQDWASSGNCRRLLGFPGVCPSEVIASLVLSLRMMDGSLASMLELGYPALPTLAAWCMVADGDPMDDGPDSRPLPHPALLESRDMYFKFQDTHNLLRPETVESFYYLHRATRNQRYREWGWAIFR